MTPLSNSVASFHPYRGKTTSLARETLEPFPLVIICIRKLSIAQLMALPSVR